MMQHEPQTPTGLIPTINSRGKLVFGNEVVSEEEASDEESSIKESK